jgi:hypothetical protein
MVRFEYIVSFTLNVLFRFSISPLAKQEKSNLSCTFHTIPNYIFICCGTASFQKSHYYFQYMIWKQKIVGLVNWHIYLFIYLHNDLVSIITVNPNFKHRCLNCQKKTIEILHS